MNQCNRCPRACQVDRAVDLGYCRSGDSMVVASICVHQGEEPPVSGNQGILNIFFYHCNLQCVYCQNKQISDNHRSLGGMALTVEALVSKIALYMERGGQAIGFVSPSHYAQQVVDTLKELKKKGYKPIVVYNTNAYDTVDTIRLLEPFVDIYLPDYKYADAALAHTLSGAADYPLVALRAIKEMYRQKGNQLIENNDGYAMQGLIIRHLVLPGYVENSKKVLQSVAEDVSSNVYVSLMAQYNPAFYQGTDPNLHRTLTPGEYEEVCSYYEKLGLHRGWIQALDSSLHYNPDFSANHPFEY